MNCNISKKDYIVKLDNTSSLFKRVVNRLKRHLNNNKLRITGKSTGGGNHAWISKDCLGGTLRIYFLGNNNTLCIDEGCNLKHNNTIFSSGDNNYVHIGKNVTFDQNVSIVCCEGTNVEIGNGSIFANNVRIRTSDQHAIYNLDDDERLNRAENVIIEDHVWLGNSVVINKGVHVKSGSMVGIGAIVTHDIPSNCVAVGVPAKVVRQNIRWTEDL